MSADLRLWTDESGPRNPFSWSEGLTVRNARNVSSLVQGSGDFPTDMLRYDRGRALTPLPDPGEYHMKPFRVVVQTQVDPTVKRWESRGWRIVQEVPQDQRLDSRLTRMGVAGAHCHRCNQGHGRIALSRLTGEPICKVCWEAEATHARFAIGWATMRHAIWHGDYTYDGSVFLEFDAQSA